MVHESTLNRLEKALLKPTAFQRLVDELPDNQTKFGLQAWGLIHGLYHLRFPEAEDCLQANQQTD